MKQFENQRLHYWDLLFLPLLRRWFLFQVWEEEGNGMEYTGSLCIHLWLLVPYGNVLFWQDVG